MQFKKIVLIEAYSNIKIKYPYLIESNSPFFLQFKIFFQQSIQDKISVSWIFLQFRSDCWKKWKIIAKLPDIRLFQCSLGSLLKTNFQAPSPQAGHLSDVEVWKNNPQSRGFLRKFHHGFRPQQGHVGDGNILERSQRNLVINWPVQKQGVDGALIFLWCCVP